jgi:formyltetrahydrofolate hydrolase
MSMIRLFYPAIRWKKLTGVSITTLDEVLVDADADIVLLIDYMKILSKSFFYYSMALCRL